MQIPKPTRRQFIRSLILAGGATGAWMRFVEPWWVREAFHTIPLGLGGLKLLHLADLHADPMPLSFLSQQIHRALAWKPDFICVTGDFITTKFDEWDAYAAILRTLQATAPTFATLGNHDGGRWARTKGYSDTQPVRELLEHGKLTLLHNTQHDIELHGRRIKLIGLGSQTSKELKSFTITLQKQKRTFVRFCF